jgi:hypothetical protein
MMAVINALQQPVLIITRAKAFANRHFLMICYYASAFV